MKHYLIFSSLVAGTLLGAVLLPPTQTSFAQSALNTPPPPSATVNASALNVRIEPGTDATVIYQLPQGAQVIVLGQRSWGESIWYQIQPVLAQAFRRVGWVSGQYITVNTSYGFGDADRYAAQVEQVCLNLAQNSGYRVYHQTAARRAASFYLMALSASTHSGSRYSMTCLYSTVSQTVRIDDVILIMRPPPNTSSQSR